MPRYWALLDADAPGFQGRLRELADRAEAADGSPEELERDLIAHHERLSRAIAEAPAVHANLTELTDTLGDDAVGAPWPPTQTVSLSTGDYVTMPASARGTLLHEVAAWLGSLDSSLELHHRRGEMRAQPIRLEGIPIALGITPIALTSDVTITMATPVRRALAPVRLQRQTWLHTFTTAVRLQSDTRLGDDAFDDHFLVEAEEAAAKQLLDAPLRRELLALAHFATPRLVLADGLARLTISYAFSPMLLERATRVLAMVRAVEVPVRLLR
ncbi:MAG TPA: hypothetical protein ENK57_04920 [Polyangiaceae bacterium]|nr:hypothetical protein [Polyangiaceae bacterium]